MFKTAAAFDGNTIHCVMSYDYLLYIVVKEDADGRDKGLTAGQFPCLGLLCYNRLRVPSAQGWHA